MDGPNRTQTGHLLPPAIDIIDISRRFVVIGVYAIRDSFWVCSDLR